LWRTPFESQGGKKRPLKKGKVSPLKRRLCPPCKAPKMGGKERRPQKRGHLKGVPKRAPNPNVGPQPLNPRHILWGRKKLAPLGKEPYSRL